MNELRSMNATPHVAQNISGRTSAIDGRTTRHAGYALSQRIRKRIEEAFGWIKTVASHARASPPRLPAGRRLRSLTQLPASHQLRAMPAICSAARSVGECAAR